MIVTGVAVYLIIGSYAHRLLTVTVRVFVCEAVRACDKVWSCEIMTVKSLFLVIALELPVPLGLLF